jgi:hypothetical protein
VAAVAIARFKLKRDRIDSAIAPKTPIARSHLNKAIAPHRYSQLLEFKMLNFLSFSEFESQVSKVFKGDFNTVNFTDKSHFGCSDTVYTAEKGFYAIEYTLLRVWKYHFNGTIGEGETLDSAIANHAEQYGGICNPNN